MIFRQIREAAAGLRAIGQAVEKGFLSNLSGSPLVGDWHRGVTMGEPAGASAPYASHGTIYRAVNVYAKTMGRIPIKVFPDDTEKAVALEGHWLPNLLEAPGYGRQGTQLIQATILNLKLRGEAFWWHLDIRRGEMSAVQRPHAIAMVSPLTMKIHKKENGAVKTWDCSTQGVPRFLDADEITFHRYENPYNEDRGLGPVQAVMVELTGDMRAAQWYKTFYDNDARPPILFVPKEGTWLDQDRRKFMAGWNANQAGTRNAGKAATLPKPMDIKEFGFNQAEQDYFEGRRFLGQKLLQPIGVPPFLAGDLDRASYANSQEQLKSWYMNDVSPDAVDLGAVVTAMARMYEPGVRVIFDMAPLLADVTAKEYGEKIETANMMWRWGLTVEEINRRLGLGLEIKAGADQEHLRTGFLPTTVVPAAMLLEPPEEEVDPEPPPVPPEPDPEDDDPEEEERTALVAAIKATPLIDLQGPEETAPGVYRSTYTATKETAEERDARELAMLSSGLARRYAEHSRPYMRVLRTWMWKLRGEVLANINALATKGMDDPMPDVDIESLLFNGEVAEAALVTVSTPYWGRAFMSGATTVSEDLAMELGFDLSDGEAQAFLADKKIQIKRVSNNLKEKARRSIAASMSRGDSIREAARTIRSDFNQYRGQALTIARTEMAQAFGGGRYLAAGRLGVKRIQWVSSRDKRVRETHDFSQTIRYGSHFKNGVKYPGDPSGPPEEVINCRCQIRHLRR